MASRSSSSVESLVIVGALGVGAWWLLKQTSAAGALFAPVEQAAGTVAADIQAGADWLIHGPPNTTLPAADPAGQWISDNLVEPVIGLVTGQPRGIRDNNPTNIKWAPGNPWAGQVSPDLPFAKFADPASGIRAAFKVLQSYAREGYTTPVEIAGRWNQSGNLNSFQNYLNTLFAISGMSPADQLDTTDFQSMADFVQGLIGAENGQQWAGYYPPEIFQAAWGSL